MNYNCTHCEDTGHSRLPSGEVSDYLDCRHCGAAAERADMEAAFPLAANEYPDMAWAIHQRARDQAYAEIVRLSKERAQAEARIVSSTDAFKRIAQAHHAALVAGNGNAGEIAKLAAYLGLVPHIDAQTARIADLERQLAEASAPAVVQQPFGYFREMLNHEGKGNGVYLGVTEKKVSEQGHIPGETSETMIELYAAPQAADTDKLREALQSLYSAVDSCIDLTPEVMHKAKAALDSTALQAPVREVPEPEPDMLWEAADPEDGVTGNSPKDFAENYASAAVGRGETHDVDVLCATRSHKRTMRVSVSADEDAENWLHWEWVDALPAAPVQKEGE